MSKRSTEKHSLARRLSKTSIIFSAAHIHTLFHPQISPTWQPTQFTLISALNFSDTIPIIAPACQRDICKCTRGVEFQYTSTCRTNCITLHCIASHHITVIVLLLLIWKSLRSCICPLTIKYGPNWTSILGKLYEGVGQSENLSTGNVLQAFCTHAFILTQIAKGRLSHCGKAVCVCVITPVFIGHLYWRCNKGTWVLFGPISMFSNFYRLDVRNKNYGVTLVYLRFISKNQTENPATRGTNILVNKFPWFRASLK